MRALAGDLRLTLRNPARRPGFTATAEVTLALGIGVDSLVSTRAAALVPRPRPGVAVAGAAVGLLLATAPPND